MAYKKKKSPIALARDDIRGRAMSVDAGLAELENTVIGDCLYNPRQIALVSTILTAEDFGSLHARIAFESMLILGTKNVPVDTLTVYNEIKERGLDTSATLDVLLDMMNLSTGMANTEVRARIIKEQSIRRQVYVYCADIAKRCNAWEDVFDVLAVAETGLDTINRQVTRNRTRSNYEILRSIEDNRQRPSGFTLFGIEELDNRLGLGERGEIITIGARPSMGKTIICDQVAIHVGIELGRPVLLWTLEMPAEDIMIRLICTLASLSYGEVKHGTLDKEQTRRYNAAADRIIQSNITIIDSTGPTMSDIRAVAHTMKRSKGLDLLIIDHGTLIEPMGDDVHRLEIGKTTRLMKRNSRELDCVTIHAYQLNKEVDKRPDKRPHLIDLKESGSVEEDSDRVIFLWRPEAYGLKSVQIDNEEFDTEDAIFLLQDKYRNGKKGFAMAKFVGHHFRIEGIKTVMPEGGLPF